MTTLIQILSDPSAKWSRRQASSESTIQSLIEGCNFELPDEYLTFLRFSSGGEGFLCIEPWYFQLWSAEEVVSYNDGYKVEEFLPGYFAIGSSGGGEMLAIRKADGSPCPVYMVPFIPMEESDAVQIASDFEMFAMALGRDSSET